jgi:hypothetical protein
MRFFVLPPRFAWNRKKLSGGQFLRTSEGGFAMAEIDSESGAEFPENRGKDAHGSTIPSPLQVKEEEIDNARIAKEKAQAKAGGHHRGRSRREDG